jgi:hypothetical protein
MSGSLRANRRLCFTPIPAVSLPFSIISDTKVEDNDPEYRAQMQSQRSHVTAATQQALTESRRERDRRLLQRGINAAAALNPPVAKRSSDRYESIPVECSQHLLHQRQKRTPSCWDEKTVHSWLADKQYRSLLEGTLWDNNGRATFTPVMLSQVGQPWKKWNGGLLALALAHPTTFLHFMGANAVKFFCDLETLFASEVIGYGGSVIRARRNDRTLRAGSMSTWTVAQVEAIMRDKQYAHKLHGLQWNGLHLDAALRFPGALLGFMGADGICFWRDLVMLAHGPPADEASLTADNMRSCPRVSPEKF